VTDRAKSGRPPAVPPAAPRTGAAERRAERLAAALRANLGRRKAQARERDGDLPPDPAAKPRQG